MVLAKTTVLTGALIAVFMCLFPPYKGQAVSPRKTIPLAAGYHYILDPPQGDRFNTGHSEFVVTYELNSDRLGGQLLLVGLFTFSTAVILRWKALH
ncbi:MAG: hypothetical protein KDA57_11575 [Planctomycetales bacterium]|nr:hypothetical protein [Planctomycetales bacterium]